jgi:hypothetical protein
MQRLVRVCLICGAQIGELCDDSDQLDDAVYEVMNEAFDIVADEHGPRAQVRYNLVADAIEQATGNWV